MTPETESFWEPIYKNLPDDGSLISTLTDRDGAQIRRLAMIYAALDCSTAIEIPHLEAALEVWRYSEQSAWVLYGHTGNERDQLLKLIATGGEQGLSRSALYDKFASNHITKKELDELLDDLSAEDLIFRHKVKDTGGRPAIFAALSPGGEKYLQAMSKSGEEREVTSGRDSE